ncbi:bifunctional adenosylcobinamide kinase/adenosylcobinamide-phosphate guanylyltransferase [Ottowia sp. GY511]|uniref:Bifunctional adenosylcobalamin biosynthesis protein n=1 Tax=Ottowia flava TaxID=2675430 RepID=A0ABW4KY21_9BURK|nr:bifunctional adenosylcobinamide kinase/adenosylcobinamide-phosphate guanylyltransferase [Ottowia sp. GY511]TXK26601.1 bifunctional adenosylcobinamide kinase/adenosylcobinamide-phosphate guanylyltransferase [Ottowia sp. GY511]
MAQREFILGGQKSGKSRRAEQLAADWLAADGAHRAVLIATAQAHDDEMRARIRRHQQDRAARVPALHTVEAPRELAAALAECSRADTLVVVDCLTLWLTHWLMPHADTASEQNTVLAHGWTAQEAHFFEALGAAPGPVVLVGNEIGLGVIPLGREVRAFVDALGALNQRVAAACDRVTLMVAGCPLALKGSL